MEPLKARAYTDLLVPNLFRSEKHNKSYAKLRQEYDNCEKWCPSTFRGIKKGEGLDFVRWRQNSWNFRTIAIIWHNSNPLTMSLLWRQFDTKGLLGSQKMRTRVTIEWTYCMIFILWFRDSVRRSLDFHGATCEHRLLRSCRPWCRLF